MAVQAKEPGKQNRWGLLPIILLLIFSAYSSDLCAQFQATPVKKSDNHVTSNGKDYYVHEVRKGHTLYSIAKAYGVTEEEIKACNPAISDNALSVGLVIKIPDHTRSGTEVKDDTQKRFLIHQVKPKETLSALARKYGIRVDDIKQANPEIRGGIQIGQEVKIPRNKITIVQSEPTVLNEPLNLDSALSVLTHEEEKPEQPCSSTSYIHNNEHFEIAMLLPLHVEETENLLFDNTLDENYFRYYEFLEGAYLALDSLRQSGLNVTFSVYDTDRNPEKVKQLIRSGQLNQVDLIIGPVYPGELEVAAPFAKNRQIPLVTPLSSFDLTTGNPYVFQARLKPERQIEGAIDYLASQYEDNLVVVCMKTRQDDPDFQYFYQRLVQKIRYVDPAHKASANLLLFNEISRSFYNSEGNLVRIDDYLSRSVFNRIILPNDDEVYTTELINQLNTKSASYPLSAFGLYQSAFTNLSLENLFNVNLELFGDLEEYPFVDDQDTGAQNFYNTYRDNWNSDPSRYSYQGFDLTYYFGSALLHFGRNITASVPCWSETLSHPALQTPLRFSSAGGGNGFDNLALPIIRFQRDDLVRKRVD